MKRIAFVISLLTIFCTIARAQQDYFIFIWSEQQQPFYVRLGGQTFSSSAIGHLVIPRLKDSTYSLELGFPKKQFAERAFTVTFNKKDLDYQLKNTPDNGWVLIDAQTSETLQPRQDNQVKNTNPSLGERNTGAFATLMAGLVNDSAVMYKSITKADAVQAKPAETIVKTDSAVAQTKEKDVQMVEGTPAVIIAPVDTMQKQKETVVAKIDSAKTNTITQTDSAAAPLSTVIQVQEWWNDKGKGLIYYDSTAVGTDTISIVIDFEKGGALPTPEQVIAVPAKIDSAKAAITTPDTLAIVQKKAEPAKDSIEKVAAIVTPDTPAIKTEEKVVKNIPDSVAQETTEKVAATTPPVNTPAKDSTEKPAAANTQSQPNSQTAAIASRPDSTTGKTTDAVVKTDSTAAAKKPLLIMNSDCTDFASEYDVDKLRVKMLSTSNVDDKIGAAKKVFKTKCFVTRYIRGLSELFPSDEARFKFFDAAYPFVSDTGNFRTLLDLFTDDLYIARFKALVRM